MHRNVQTTVAPEATDDLVKRLLATEGVINLAVTRGEGVKPPGDVISAQVLNTGIDDVLGLIERAANGGTLSVSTSTIDSLMDSEQHLQVRGDLDEATWEEAETAMRRHTRPNLNFALTTAAGGIIATCALVASSETTEAVALVAAAIIAPSFEPLARIGLAITNRHASTLREALRVAVLSYVILIVSAIVMMLLLRTGSHGFVEHFYASGTVHEIRHPPATNLFISAAGAIAGVIMVASGRFTQLPGALVALQLLPAAVTIGAGIEVGSGTIIAHSLGRLAIDIVMVIVAGIIVFTYKHMTAHDGRRTPV